MDSVLFDENQLPLEQILIVDDEETIRNLFTFCLESRYVCVAAASVAEALERLAETEFELIITDLMMPESSGVDLLDHVREISPDTWVIMASGIGDPHSALEAVRRGAFDYLIKPCNLGDLELTVERALENRRLKIEARQYKQDLETRNRQLAHGKAELERLQAQVVHHEKTASLGQFAADIVHEINVPVGLIRGNLADLKQPVAQLRERLAGGENADARAFKQNNECQTIIGNLSLLIDDCGENVERIGDIARKLQDFSHVGKTEFLKINVHTGIDWAIQKLSPYNQAGNLTVHRDFGNLPPIDAFADELNQVWLHLLINAAQAVGARAGQAVIRTFAENDSVFVEISDDGDGIAPEHLNRIYEPFFTTKAGGGNSGLGLSTAADIVAQHGGAISVDSELQKGTIFMVRLPIDNSEMPHERLNINWQRTI